MASAAKSSFTNYARLGCAAQSELPNVLQKLLTIKEPPHLLSMHVNANKSLSRYLRAHEWKQITGVQLNGYRNLDISLCYKLIRNLNLVPPPTQGWDFPADPTPLELTVGDDIERIRRKRNEVLHRGNTLVTDQELTDYFTIFKSISGRLEIYLGTAKNEFVSTFEHLESCCMDIETEKMYLENLEILMKNENTFKEQISLVKNTVQMIEEQEQDLKITLNEHKVSIQSLDNDIKNTASKFKSGTETLEKVTEQHQQNIKTLEQSTCSQILRIKALEDATEKSDYKTENLNAKTDDHEVKIENLEVSVDEHEIKIENLEDTTDEHQNMIGTLEDLTDQHQGKIGTLEEQTNQHRDQIVELEEHTTVHTEQIGTLKEITDTSHENIKTLNKRTDVHQDKIETLEMDNLTQEEKEQYKINQEYHKKKKMESIYTAIDLAQEQYKNELALFQQTTTEKATSNANKIDALADQIKAALEDMNLVESLSAEFNAFVENMTRETQEASEMALQRSQQHQTHMSNLSRELRETMLDQPVLSDDHIALKTTDSPKGVNNDAA
ncbi:unnamed protein product [Mytilus edulis]|uniref:DZIP3-like HEPN domain-containing protein n=1 Tax=Mytilus edulis TaxID=6550 RepID=A0A8S3T2H6_MYTED|nr:unnamed protein product [Mytilus edulis]